MICVEKDTVHYAFIKKVKDELKTNQLRTVRADALKYIESVGRKFDFIFADPPYTLKELPQIPERILSHDLLNPNGIFVIEHAKKHDFSHLPGFLQRRIYGAVNFSIFC